MHRSDRPGDAREAPTSETIRRRAYRLSFPIVVVAVSTIWAIERVEGFPHDVDRYGLPALAVVYLMAALTLRFRPSWLRATEFATLLATYAFFFAAAAASLAAGRLGDQLLGLNGYLPMVFAVAFLMLGPGPGAVASAVLYLGFAAVAGWGIASGELTLGQAMPLFLGSGMLLALLYAVARNVAASARYQARMELEAATDTLTGALNRRGGVSALERQRGAFALLLVDLNRFKAINDRYGHTRGDEALVRTASAIEHDLRPRDLLVRWGGDEFLVIAPDADAAAGRALAERVRARVRAAGDAAGVRLEASVGVAARRDEEGWTSVIDRADADMYAAKDRPGPTRHA